MSPGRIDTTQLADDVAGDETTGSEPRSDGGLMTVGELARLTGLTVKAIRQYEALG